MLLDSNILIYLAQPGGEKLQAQLTSAQPAASLISRVEAQGFHRITPKEEARLDKLFAWVEVLPVSDAVADAAIILRRQLSDEAGRPADRGHGAALQPAPGDAECGVKARGDSAARMCCCM